MSDATQPSAIFIREIESISEMRDVESLEKEVWDCDDRDIVPLTVLAAVKEAGGILIGAYDELSLVGFAFGFVGLEDGETVHHSHMLGVRSSYRSYNLGYRLKMAQRERALQQGITRMTWTFDPLQSLNAYFNFGKLGVLSDRYKINFYGETTTSPLHQTGTDRLWVTWLLDSRRVNERVEHGTTTNLDEWPRTILIRCTSANAPERVASISDIKGTAAIEIPHDINFIERTASEQALQWRRETRDAFREALTEGFVVEEFVRGSAASQASSYLLTKRRLEDFS
jgi:predicted GNAT superfamily acetyltransferase